MEEWCLRATAAGRWSRLTLVRACGKGLGPSWVCFYRIAGMLNISFPSLRPLLQLELAHHGLQIESEAREILARRRRLLGADSGLLNQLGNLIDIHIDLLGGAGLLGSRSRNLGDHSPYLLRHLNNGS